MDGGIIDIGRSSSTCCNCGRGALPSELGHYTLAGYDVKPGEVGCGIKWKYMYSNYTGPGVGERMRKKFPHLILMNGEEDE